ncbi:MAG: amidohydrolase family protein [Actinobacteria bacterium]|nr:amidohydrolase family protein [Actinomycetota bacterium]
MIAHVTAHQTVEAVAAARAGGADVWVETCPHYLCMSLEEMAGDTRLKWNPPSRDRASVDRLWEALAAGRVHTIASDHAPTGKTPGADIWTQFPGAGNGLEGMLPLVATEAARHGVALPLLVEALSTTPAKLFGLYPHKGAIAIGADADLCTSRRTAARCSTPPSSSTTSRSAGRPSTAVRSPSTLSTRSCAASLSSPRARSWVRPATVASWAAVAADAADPTRARAPADLHRGRAGPPAAAGRDPAQPSRRDRSRLRRRPRARAGG